MPDDATTSADPGATHTVSNEKCRLGRALLVLAYAILLIATLRHIGDPWERGMRGGNAAAYSHVAVFHTVHYGLGVTLGTPAFIAETDDGIVRNVNWHHPPGYWLWLAAWGWAFGNTPTVLRIAHLVLFLPGMLALFWLVARRCGERFAGVTCLLFATCPLVAYYGAMVCQDGAVLASGLWTIWAFERHLARPSKRRWVLTAALFFVTCSIDFTGYWWGPAMFVMALGHEHRRRAVLTVMTLFPVSVLAFVVLALHYGLVLGGPMGFVHELLGTLHTEQKTAEVTVTDHRFAAAMTDLWLTHHNQVLAGLAVVGLVAAPFARGFVVRRLAMVGTALLVPGLLNYGAMFNHAVDHVFWSMHGFAGLCAFAALAPASAAALQRSSGAARFAGWALLLLTAGTAVWGAVRTHDVIDAFAFEPGNDTPALITKALPYLPGCNTTMTSGRTTTQKQYGHTSVFFEIDTADKLRTVLAFARANKLRGKVGFVVHPAHRDGDLPPLLDSMATRQEVDGALVYQLSL